MSVRSCLYEGDVRHRRFTPVRHEFRYRLFLMYIDLDELPTLFRGRWLWSADHPNVAWFRRGDHLGPPAQPLAESVRDLVEARTGVRSSGAIRLLTHFRYFGFELNPISLYYCFDSADRVEFVVAEVNNTPWGQQHCYVLDPLSADRQRVFAARVPKELHVSPFFDMNFDYHFRLTAPGESLVVQIENHERPRATGQPAFDATLRLRRRPLTGPVLARALCLYPHMTGQVVAKIYWQAFQLWRLRIPFVPHPKPPGTGGASRPVKPQPRNHSTPGMHAMHRGDAC